MRLTRLSANSDIFMLNDFINATSYAVHSAKNKSEILLFLTELSSAGANVLKQEALALGGDLLTHKNTVLGKEERHKALLIVTPKIGEILAQKLLLQDFGLKELAQDLSAHLKAKRPEKAQIMGVININEDSFNAASRVDEKGFLKRALSQIEAGADILDIGAASSRPGSIYCGEEEEMRRLAGVLALIKEEKLHDRVRLSLDSFSPLCLRAALDLGFSIINDISADLALVDLAKEYGASYLLMHMRGLPENMHKQGFYEDLLSEMYAFFEEKLEALNYENVILDPGFGFAKDAAQNLILLKHLGHFLPLGKPVLAGLSRKNTVNYYSPSEVDQRLAGSLFLHLKAVEEGASIIRVHDVREHKQMLRLYEAYEGLSMKDNFGALR